MPYAIIVEDNPSDLKVLQTLLKRQNWEVANFEAVSFIEQLPNLAPPDLLFLDLEMPNANGYTVLEAVQATPQFESVPVVAYSSHTSEMAAAQEAGFHSFLGKPLESALFGEQIAAILQGQPIWAAR
jgi:twitching motility two-component system response regulator PilH